MIKIIFLADTHLGFDFPIRPKKEKRRRGGDFFDNFDFILEYAKKEKADLVIHGGDLFFRTLIPPPIVDMVYERIFNFAESGIPIVIVPGNHESSRLPVSLFMQHPNIYYFTKPESFKFNLKGINFDIAGFPCVRKDVKSKFPEIIDEIRPLMDDNTIKILCMHQSIEGAKVGPVNFTFRNGKDVIQINQLTEDFDLFLSGHIHRAQILRSNSNTPIIYPGSIERTAFAEMDEEKGFYEINIDANSNISFKFIGLQTRPMVDIVLEKENYTTSTLQDDILYQIKTLSKDCIIRFKFTNKENLPKLKSSIIDSILPSTMNYQIAGMKEFYRSNK